MPFLDVGRVASRGLSLAVAATLFVSSTAEGFVGVAESVTSVAIQYSRLPRGHFTEAPRPAFRGSNPRRDPHGRGGLWTKRSQEIADIGDGTLYAWLQGPPVPPPHSTPVAAEPGSSLPWEGSSGGVNTGNGNKLTSLNLLSWDARGSLTVDFTLFHNSQTAYNDELGHGWTWTYDIYLNLATADPVLHWGDGTCIPYTAPGTPGNPYVAPAGIYDSLVQNSGGTWTLTTKDQIKYQFNAAGFCNAIQDRNGNQITLTLNAQNYVTKVQDPTGRYYNVSLDGSNNFQSITDHTGRTWTFTRNGSDDLTTVTWPTLNSTTYTDTFAYNANHDITTQTNRRGKSWTYTYNTDGSLATETNPLSKTWTYTYGGSYTQITDPLGKYEQHNYSSGKLASITDESGFSYSYTARNGNNEATTKVDKRGNTWTYTYDSAGNVLTQTNPLSKTWTYTYNATNDPLTVTTPLSDTRTYAYDSNGNLLTVTDPLSRTALTNTYGSYGLLAASKDALNRTTSFTYDSNGHLDTVTDPASVVTTTTFDSLGRLTGATDALLYTESFAYDDWGRPTTLTHPGSSTITVAYNAVDQKTSETDELSRTQSYVYDNAGRLTSYTNALSEVESYGYDDANRRTTVTNGRGYTRTYAFTDRGDVASLTLPDSSVEGWSYDGAGNNTAYTNPLSQVINYVYDNAGRQTTIDYPTGTDTTFAYDDSGRRTSMVDATGTTTWTLNSASEVTQLAQPQGTTQYAYNAAGQRTTLTDVGQGSTTYAYDATNGRLTSQTNRFSEVTSFGYDTVGRVSQITFHSRQYEVYGYDSRSRLTSLALRKSDTSLLRNRTYAYDSASQMTSQSVAGVTTTYGYDAQSQITSESRTGYSASYTYDANGNRATRTVGGITETYAYDDADKLQTISIGGTTVKTYGYDTAGRTTSVVSSAGTTTVGYDYEGRATSISGPGIPSQTNIYNGLNTRVSKTEGSTTNTFVRDGAHVTGQVLRDGAATYTPGISERRGSTTKYLHSGIKNADAELSTSQAYAGSRVYDAFGNVTSSTGTWSGPFGYGGQFGYQEDGTGLTLLGHRLYDSSNGRFLTRDPIEAGRNWYVYCENNPITSEDADGLMSTAITGARALGTFTPAPSMIGPSATPGAAKIGQAVAAIIGMIDAMMKSVGGGGADDGDGAAPQIEDDLPDPNVGVYELPKNPPYVGQSGDIARRLKEHVQSGKSTQGQADNAVITPVSGGKREREIAEQQVNDQIHGGIDNLENLINPVSALKRIALGLQ